jgi:hypothetical protein
LIFTFIFLITIIYFRSFYLINFFSVSSFSFWFARDWISRFFFVSASGLMTWITSLKISHRRTSFF